VWDSSIVRAEQVGADPVGVGTRADVLGTADADDAAPDDGQAITATTDCHGSAQEADYTRPPR
jgi:hypothetical protein